MSLLATVAAVGTVGSLVAAAVLLPARADGGLGATARRAASAAGRWAAGWAVLTACELVLTASDVAGVPVTRIGGGAVAEVASTRPGTALCLTATLATVIGVSAGASRTSAGAGVLLIVSVAGLLPGAVAGHASSAPGHDVVVSALVVHVVAVSLWTGGLLGLVLHVRTEPTLLPGAVARFSPLALGAYLALAGSGLIAVAERLGDSGAAWASGYGALAAAKATALLVLGLLGHLHRRTTIASLAREGDGRPFLRLAGVELLLMGVAIGLASALSRTAVPVPVEVRPDHGTGHPTLPAVVEPLSLVELATAWRPDAIVLVVLATAAAAYAGGVRDLRRRGHLWPRARAVAFAAGICVALVVLCSGVATYAPAVLSVQVAQLLVALLLVPLLLLLGDPAGLAVEVGTARGTDAPARLLRSGVARAAASAVPGALAVCVLLLAVYRTPLIEMSQRSSWMHLAVLTLALVSGLLLLWPVLGAEVDPATRRCHRVAVGRGRRRRLPGDPRRPAAVRRSPAGGGVVPRAAVELDRPRGGPATGGCAGGRGLRRGGRRGGPARRAAAHPPGHRVGVTRPVATASAACAPSGPRRAPSRSRASPRSCRGCRPSRRRCPRGTVKVRL